MADDAAAAEGVEALSVDPAAPRKA